MSAPPSIVRRLKAAHKALFAVFMLSVIGLATEMIFAYLYGSMILLADVFHWLVDALLELTLVVSIYLASKTYRRFSWSFLYFESALAIIITVTVMVVYFYSFIGFVRGVIGREAEVTTKNPLLALVTGFGGLVTLVSYSHLRKAYSALRLEVLRAESWHALIDVVAAFAATGGVAATALTGDLAVELAAILVITAFALHSVAEVLEDVIKSLLGVGADPQIKYEIMRKLEGLEKAWLRNLELRKVGSFYIARVEMYLDPKTTILEAHKLRRRVIALCREACDMIYHIDVSFYPRLGDYVRTRKRR